MGEALMPRRGGGYKAHGFVEGGMDCLTIVTPGVVKLVYVRLVDPVEDYIVRADDQSGHLGDVTITEACFMYTGEQPSTAAVDYDKAGCTAFTSCRVNNGEYVSDNYKKAPIPGGMYGFPEGDTFTTLVTMLGNSVSINTSSYVNAWFDGTYEYFIYE